jgi:hypothetical protein
MAGAVDLGHHHAREVADAVRGELCLAEDRRGVRLGG